MMKKWCAIIPARGGSKRLLRKNILPFFDRPMIEWTIQAAIDSQKFDYVMVSTDDQETAQISEKAGAQVPFLRTKFADDSSNVSEVVIHCLSELKEKKGLEFENVAMLMPNCPNRNANDVADAVGNYSKRGLTYQISSTKPVGFIPWWLHSVNDGVATPLFPEQMKKRSQDLPDLQSPTGCIWLAKVSELKAHGSFYGPKYSFHELPWRASVDIDTREDFDFALAARAPKA